VSGKRDSSLNWSFCCWLSKATRLSFGETSYCKLVY